MQTPEIESLQSKLLALEKFNEELKTQLAAIHARNIKVELNKKWETSSTRFLCVTGITYVTMNLILWTIGGPFPPIHAIVPTFGYMLSTLSLPKVKRWWMLKQQSGSCE